MALLRCKACNKLYSYEKEGFCPKCGAYNRPPRKEWVDPDGSIHYMNQRDADSGAVPSHRGKKVCFEQETERRRKKPAVNWQEAYQSAQNSFSKGSRRVSVKGGKGVAIAIAVIVAVNIVSAVVENIGDFTAVISPEPNYEAPAYGVVELIEYADMEEPFPLANGLAEVTSCSYSEEDDTLRIQVCTTADADAEDILMDARLVWQYMDGDEPQGWISWMEMVSDNTTDYTLTYDAFSFSDNVIEKLWLVFTDTNGSEIWVTLAEDRDPSTVTPTTTVALQESFTLGGAACAVSSTPDKRYIDPTVDPQELKYGVAVAGWNEDTFPLLSAGQLVWRNAESDTVEGYLPCAETRKYSGSSYTLTFDRNEIPPAAEMSALWLVFTDADGSEIWVTLDLPAEA